jgi:hypothetical protein
MNSVEQTKFVKNDLALRIKTFISDMDAIEIEKVSIRIEWKCNYSNPDQSTDIRILDELHFYVILKTGKGNHVKEPISIIRSYSIEDSKDFNLFSDHKDVIDNEGFQSIIRSAISRVDERIKKACNEEYARSKDSVKEKIRKAIKTKIKNDIKNEIQENFKKAVFYVNEEDILKMWREAVSSYILNS